jgi:DNA polymerase-3 subunit gamma/tau
MNDLLVAWDAFAASRKHQAAEHQILKREFKFEHPVVMIALTNPVEESLLDNFKRDLIQFLRDQLRNSELTIATSLQETIGKKVVYTSKEKFEHLAEKHPKLWDLKDRMGLDWDI